MTITIINGVQQGFDRGFAHFRESQTANTHAGTFTNGAWRTRVLNTEVANTIPGCSLASDQVTLPPGTYDFEWSAPVGNSVGATKSRLYNATASAVVVTGHESTAAGASVVVSSRGAGRATFSVNTTVQLEHICTNTIASTGLGRAANLDSQPEVYAELWIWKV